MRIQTTIAAVLISASFLASCSTGGQNQTRASYVQVSTSGAIRVNGKPVSAKDAGPALRRSGVSTASPVNVHVPEDFSDGVRQALTVSLHNSGFTRVLFIKPKQAVVDVAEPGVRPTQKAQPAPTGSRLQPTK